MNKIQEGLVGGVVGGVMGFLLITMVNSFAEDGLIPGCSVWLFGLFSIIASIVTLNSFRFLGLLYTIGWLLGSLLIIDILGPVGIAFNIAGPAIIIILRLYFWIKSAINNYQ